MDWMNHALSLAQQGRATCMPNPMVGAVIVKGDTIIGSGYHVKTGGPHAEIIALEQAGSQAVGADLYVTLEPCSHFGRTPPCVDALIKSGIHSVHVAIADPNPLVNGSGIEKLQRAGITVIVGEKQEEAYQLNKTFFHYISTHTPFVIAKWAMSLDGKITHSSSQQAIDRSPVWITTEQARAHSHTIRSQVSAIMVGAGTIEKDNPHLTVRYNAHTTARQPRPIIITDLQDLPHDSHVFASERNALVITSNRTPASLLAMLDKRIIEHYQFPLNDNCFDLSAILSKLAQLQISSVLVEGGTFLLTEFFRNNLVNKLYAYIAPIIIGGNNSLSPINPLAVTGNIPPLHLLETITLGHDFCIVAETADTPRTYNNFCSFNQKGQQHV